MQNEREALIALNTIESVGPVCVRKLRRAFGSASAALKATADDLVKAKVASAVRAATLVEKFRAADPGKEIRAAEKLSIKIITEIDDDYPDILRKIHDPPIALYCYGDLNAFNAPGIAMVGTRRPSIYGQEMAQNLAYGIAMAGYCVISGMAVGIDAASHRGALLGHGKTIGVLGGAIDRFHPKSNAKLAHEAVDNGGLIISEYPMGRSPSEGTFPQRNRIISGLSLGTVVIEAALKSGSLITAGIAAEQGRPVMALPGRVDVPTAQGCNKLIQDGAVLIMTVDDIIDEISSSSLQFSLLSSHTSESRNYGTTELREVFSPSPLASSQQRKRTLKDNSEFRIPNSELARRGGAAPSLTPEEEALLKEITGEERLIDEVIAKSGIDAGRVNALVVTLQLKRIVKLLPGGWVKRV